MRVFVYVRTSTRLVRIKAEFSLGKDDPMAIVSCFLLMTVVASVHSPSAVPQLPFE